MWLKHSIDWKDKLNRANIIHYTRLKNGLNINGTAYVCTIKDFVMLENLTNISVNIRLYEIEKGKLSLSESTLRKD